MRSKTVRRRNTARLGERITRVQQAREVVFTRPHVRQDVAAPIDHVAVANHHVNRGVFANAARHLRQRVGQVQIVGVEPRDQLPARLADSRVDGSRLVQARLR